MGRLLGLMPITFKDCECAGRAGGPLAASRGDSHLDHHRLTDMGPAGQAGHPPWDSPEPLGAGARLSKVSIKSVMSKSAFKKKINYKEIMCKTVIDL